VSGFLAGFAAPLLGGLSGVYVPEWGHAGDAASYRILYREMAARWVAAGRTTHAVTVFTGDTLARSCWFDMGFGSHLVDAVRRVTEPGEQPSGVTVDRADQSDLDAVVTLEVASAGHLGSSPTFIRREPQSREALQARLDDPDSPIFVARAGGEVIGSVTACPSHDAPLSIRRHAAVRIDGMFVAPTVRRVGAGRALVEAVMAWAIEQSATWVAVDYETANLEAAAFWPRCGFEPVLLSLARTIGHPAG
jgi:GNAT superfamily N-acetyltransferase